MTREEAINLIKTWNPIHPLKKEAIEVAINALEQPNVVRCKDCKHRPYKFGDGDHEVDFPDGVCPCQTPDDDWCSWYPADDWFCGNGEQREGADEE